MSVGMAFRGVDCCVLSAADRESYENLGCVPGGVSAERTGRLRQQHVAS